MHSTETWKAGFLACADFQAPWLAFLWVLTGTEMIFEQSCGHDRGWSMTLSKDTRVFKMPCGVAAFGPQAISQEHAKVLLLLRSDNILSNNLLLRFEKRLISRP
jgi:hypothetical protein